MYTARGEVVTTTGGEEVILYSDVDLDLLDSIREQIPISKQKRHDVYQVVESIATDECGDDRCPSAIS